MQGCPGVYLLLQLYECQIFAAFQLRGYAPSVQTAQLAIQ